MSIILESNKKIEEIDKFSTISLDDLNSVALLNRFDTKYIGNIKKIESILPLITNDYNILIHNGLKTFEYRTTYLDTSELLFYNIHHQGRSNRYKVRTRTYVDSGLIYDEIKFKNNKEKTIKERNKRYNKTDIFDKEFLAFINENTVLRIISKDLKPVLTVKHKRITFTDKNFSERVTLDYNLRFNNEENNEMLKNIFIIEIKKTSIKQNTVFERALKKNEVYPSPFSKYCIGTIYTNGNVKFNRFKPLIRKINKISTEVY